MKDRMGLPRRMSSPNLLFSVMIDLLRQTFEVAECDILTVGVFDRGKQQGRDGAADRLGGIAASKHQTLRAEFADEVLDAEKRFVIGRIDIKAPMFARQAEQ